MSSNGERKIAAVLEKGEIPFLAEYKFPDLKSSRGIPLSFDFAVFDSELAKEKGEKPIFLIEMQGAQHYEKRFQTSLQFARQLENDKKKRMYCAARGITLVEIPYTEYNLITLDLILEKGKYF